MNNIPDTSELLKFFHDNGDATIIVMSHVMSVTFKCDEKEMLFCLVNNLSYTVAFNELEEFEAICSLVQDKLIMCNNKF